MKFLLSLMVLVSLSCKAKDQPIPDTTLQLVGSTPGGVEIKTLLGLKPTDSIDFMRWDITLQPAKSSFVLNLHYGLSMPNTLGFMPDSIKLRITGTYTVDTNQYTLTSKRFKMPLQFTRISDNIFHILSSDKELLVGDGGWSYTLNRRSGVLVDVVHHLSDADLFKRLRSDSSTTLIYVGRTPCEAISREQMNTVPDGCFKLKWKLVLYKDPATHAPTRYELFRTDSRQQAITGQWSMVHGVPTDPELILYVLDPGNPVKSTRLLLGDEDVLFVLKRNLQPFTGNADFSYTLNRN